MGGDRLRPIPNVLYSFGGKPRLFPRDLILGDCRDVYQYERLNLVGEGSYGVVYRARERDTGKIVALKAVHLAESAGDFPLSSLREIIALRRLSHPNIINLRDVVVSPKNLQTTFIVMDYCVQDLANLIDNMEAPFAASEIKCIMKQLVSGIAHLHANGFLHRDMKLSNILMNDEGIVKLADFGLARDVGVPQSRDLTLSPTVVTLWYRPPELLLGQPQYTTAVDVWGVGCIFAELMIKKPLFPGRTDSQQLDEIFELLGTPSEQVWRDMRSLPLSAQYRFPDQPYNRIKSAFTAASLPPQGAVELLNRCLTFDPLLRIASCDILDHEYFKVSPRACEAAMMPTHPEYRNFRLHSVHK